MSKSNLEEIKLSDIYTPLKEEVVFEFIRQDRTAKGILIPEQAQKQEKICTVVAVGEKCQFVKIGDHILISPNARPKIIDLISENHIQIWESDILGIVSKEFKKEQDRKAEKEIAEKVKKNRIPEDVEVLSIVK